MKVKIGISNRHIHLSQKDAEILFGKNYNFQILKELYQRGQYAYQETVTLQGPKGKISKVRILGPYREKTQVEILMADNYKLGISAPIRLSGDLEGSERIKIIGPNGEVELEEGVIVAARHLHISDKEAENLGITHGDKIKIKTFGIREVIWENVIVRVNPRYRMEFHLDREEGNAAGLKNGDFGEIL